MKVIDNFLPPPYFQDIQSFMMGDNIPWYFNDGVKVIPEPNRFQFTHTFHDLRPRWNGACSPYFDIWDNCLRALECRKLYRIKSNLIPRTFFHRKAGWHIDPQEHSHTAIFYMNTNNGWTEFKKGRRVKFVENRIVIFDSKMVHRGVSSTNKKQRVVVNFNYEGN